MNKYAQKIESNSKYILYANYASQEVYVRIQTR